MTVRNVAAIQQVHRIVGMLTLIKNSSEFDSAAMVLAQLNQSINQTINQSIDQLIDRSINQSASQSINQSITQSISPSVSQSASQSVSQPVSQSNNSAWILGMRQAFNCNM